MLIVKRQGRKTPHSIELCGVVIALVEMEVHGNRVLGAVVPNDHPKAPAIASTLRQAAGYVVEGGPPPPPPAVLAPTPTSSIVPPVEPSRPGSIPSVGDVLRIAATNGWSAEDIDGTGQGDPGPHGGTSRTTGLTLAQMALTTPPPRWEELRATRYPWDCDGWTPPGIFTTPAVPLKVVSPEGEGDDAPGAPKATPLDAKNVAPLKDSEADDDDDEEDPDDDEDDPDAEKKGDEADPAVTSGVPAEHVDLLRNMAHELAAALGDKPLHPTRFQHAIRKINEANPELKLPPTVTKDQIAALLDRPPKPIE